MFVYPLFTFNFITSFYMELSLRSDWKLIGSSNTRPHHFKKKKQANPMQYCWKENICINIFFFFF